MSHAHNNGIRDATAAVVGIALPDEAIDVIADRVASVLEARGLLAQAPAPEGWLDTKCAAAYLGITTNALHKLTAGRLIPFEQDAPGGKCWFNRADLDAYRRGQRRAA